MKNQRKILENQPIFGKIKFFKKLFKNPLTNGEKGCIIDKLNTARPVGQAVKTLASHAENMGSIPVRVTNKKKQALLVGACFFFCDSVGIEPTQNALRFEYGFAFATRRSKSSLFRRRVCKYSPLAKFLWRPRKTRLIPVQKARGFDVLCFFFFSGECRYIHLR